MVGLSRRARSSRSSIVSFTPPYLVGSTIPAFATNPLEDGVLEPVRLQCECDDQQPHNHYRRPSSPDSFTSGKDISRLWVPILT